MRFNKAFIKSLLLAFLIPITYHAANLILTLSLTFLEKSSLPFALLHSKQFKLYIIFSIFPLISFFLAFLIGRKRKPLNPDFIAHHKLSGINLLLSSLSLIIFLPLFANTLVSLLHFISPQLEKRDLSFIKAFPFPIALFLFAVLPAILEEFLFRYRVIAILGQEMGYLETIIISSLLFSSAHLNTLIVIPIFLLSLFLGWIRIRSRSIIPSVIIHCFFNSFSILSFFILGNNASNEVSTVPSSLVLPLTLIFVIALISLILTWLFSEKKSYLQKSVE